MSYTVSIERTFGNKVVSLMKNHRETAFIFTKQFYNMEELTMKLKDYNLTSDDIKEMVDTYMIETMPRYDFVCEKAKGM